MGVLNTKIKIGDMDRQFLFESYTRTGIADELGKKTKTWTTLFSQFCMLEYKSVDESDEAGKHVMTTTGWLTTRYRSELKDNKIRATLDGKVFEIVGWQEIERRAYLKLKIKAVDI